MKHITLHVTWQVPDEYGRRKGIRVKVADTNVPELLDGKGIRNLPLLLTHALSIAGDNVERLIGFDYLFEAFTGATIGVGGFALGEEIGFHYVFEPTDDPNVFGFVMTE